jgi:hypothetical protein
MANVVIACGGRLIECRQVNHKGQLFLQLVRDRGANLNHARIHDMYADKFRVKNAWVAFKPEFLNKVAVTIGE